MENVSLNIVFWGEDSFSNIVLNSLIQAGHHVKLVISPWYDNLIYKKLEFTCSKFNIPFERYLKINSEEVFQRVKLFAPDLCVVVHFEKMIRLPILEIPRLGFINLHPSLLPQYRGRAPQHWPIINGEKETGVSVHYVDTGFDTGDIIIQERILIGKDMYVSDLQNEWIKIYSHIVVKAIEKILKGHPVVKQSALEGSYYDKLKTQQCQIKLTAGCQSAYNLIKGVSLPYHGAQFSNIIILKAHYPDSDVTKSIVDKYRTNGVYMQTDFGNFLRLPDGVLIIDKYKNVQI